MVTILYSNPFLIWAVYYFYLNSVYTWFAADVVGRSGQATAERDSASLDGRVVLGVGSAVEVLVLRPVPANIRIKSLTTRSLIIKRVFQSRVYK